jgi:hypothetical protein
MRHRLSAAPSGGEAARPGGRRWPGAPAIAPSVVPRLDAIPARDLAVAEREQRVLDELASVGVGADRQHGATVARQEAVGDLHPDPSALKVPGKRDQLRPATADPGSAREKLHVRERHMSQPPRGDPESL